MKRKMTAVIFLILALSLTALGGVKYVKTWKNPEAKPQSWRGKKVVAVAMTRLRDARAVAEEAMVRELAQLQIEGITGQSLIPPEAEKDREMAKRILREAGIAGALILSTMDVKDEASVVPNAYYMGPGYWDFWGYWQDGWAYAAGPGTVVSKSTLVVDTLIYSVEQDKVVWTGTSETTNPEDVDKVIQQLISSTRKQIKKAGLAGK
jgi:hypothetical protein